MDSNKSVQFMQSTETSNTMIVPISSMLANSSYIPSMSAQMSPPIMVNQTTSPQKFSQSENLSPTSEDLIMKIRKPYTITKQRERWTEEEHVKFLEALKLYGRQWRRIEEHIGTKTAVQIRSHAQKFFCKVEKDASSAGGSGQSTLDIDIPPPRPKRKPSHPYPRKAGSSSNCGSITDKEDDSMNGESSFRMQGSPRIVPSPASAFISAFRSQMGTIPMFPTHPHSHPHPHHAMNFPSPSTMERSVKSGKPIPMVKLFGKIVAPTPQRLPPSSYPESSMVENHTHETEGSLRSNKSAAHAHEEKEETGKCKEISLYHSEHASQPSKNASMNQEKSNQSAAVASGVSIDSKNKERQEGSSRPPNFPPWMAYPPGMMGYYHPKMQGLPAPDQNQSKLFPNPEAWHARPGMWPVPMTGEQNILHPHLNPAHLHPPHPVPPHPYPSPTSMQYPPYLHPGYAMGGYPMMAYNSQFEAYAQSSNAAAAAAAGATASGGKRSSFSPWRGPVPMWNGVRLPGNIPAMGQNGQSANGSEDPEAAAMAAASMAAAASGWWTFPGNYPPFYPGYSPSPAPGLNGLITSHPNTRSSPSLEASESEKKGSDGMNGSLEREKEKGEVNTGDNISESNDNVRGLGEDEEEEEDDNAEVKHDVSMKENKDVQSTNAASSPFSNPKTHLQNPSVQRKIEKNVKAKNMKRRNDSSSNHESNSFPRVMEEKNTNKSHDNDIDDSNSGDPSNPTPFNHCRHDIDVATNTVSALQANLLSNLSEPTSHTWTEPNANEDMSGLCPRKRQKTFVDDLAVAATTEEGEEQKKEIKEGEAEFGCENSPASDDEDERMEDGMDMQNGSSEDLQNACMGVPSSNSSACGDLRENQRSGLTDGTSSDGDGAATCQNPAENPENEKNAKGEDRKEEVSDLPREGLLDENLCKVEEEDGEDVKKREGEEKEENDLLKKDVSPTDKKERVDSFHKKGLKLSLISASSSNHGLNARVKADAIKLNDEEREKEKRQWSQENSELRKEVSNEGRIAFQKLFARASLPRSFSPPRQKDTENGEDLGCGGCEPLESGIMKQEILHEPIPEVRGHHQTSETSNNHLSAFFSSHRSNKFREGNAYYYLKEKKYASHSLPSQGSKGCEVENGAVEEDNNEEEASSFVNEDENNVSECFEKISIQAAKEEVEGEGDGIVKEASHGMENKISIDREEEEEEEDPSSLCIKKDDAKNKEAIDEEIKSNSMAETDIVLKKNGFVPYHQSELFRLNQSSQDQFKIARASSESNLHDFPPESYPFKKRGISKASSF